MWTVLLIAVAALSAVAILTFAWGIRRLRRSTNQAQAAILRVTIDDIARLRDECEAVAFRALSERLSLNDYEASARIISRRIDDLGFKKAFLKDDFWWYFVLPVGAYVGELLRVHANGVWRNSEGGGVELSIPVKDGEATTYPFDKVLKQALSGDKGDMLAYLMTAIQLENVVDAQTTTDV